MTESVVLPPIRGKHHAPVSTPVVRHSICLKCGPDDARQYRASTRGRRLAYVGMRYRNRVLKTLAAHEDPMKSKGLGRWLQGDLHPPN